MPVYVRDLEPPRSPSLSELSSTISETTQQILKDLDNYKNQNNEEKSWLNGWLDKRVVEESWEKYCVNEKIRETEKSWPKADKTIKAKSEDAEITKYLASQMEINDLGYFCEGFDLLVYVWKNGLMVNSEKMVSDDVVEDVVFVEEVVVDVAQPDKVEVKESEDGEGEGEEIRTKVDDAKVCLLVIQIVFIQIWVSWIEFRCFLGLQ